MVPWSRIVAVFIGEMPNLMRLSDATHVELCILLEKGVLQLGFTREDTPSTKTTLEEVGEKLRTPESLILSKRMRFGRPKTLKLEGMLTLSGLLRVLYHTGPFQRLISKSS